MIIRQYKLTSSSPVADDDDDDENGSSFARRETRRLPALTRILSISSALCVCERVPICWRAGRDGIDRDFPHCQLVMTMTMMKTSQLALAWKRGGKGDGDDGDGDGDGDGDRDLRTKCPSFFIAKFGTFLQNGLPTFMNSPRNALRFSMISPRNAPSILIISRENALSIFIVPYWKDLTSGISGK